MIKAANLCPLAFFPLLCVAVGVVGKVAKIAKAAKRAACAAAPHTIKKDLCP